MQINKDVLKLKMPNEKQREIMNKDEEPQIKIVYHSDNQEANAKMTGKKGIGELS